MVKIKFIVSTSSLYGLLQRSIFPGLYRNCHATGIIGSLELVGELELFGLLESVGLPVINRAHLS